MLFLSVVIHNDRDLERASQVALPDQDIVNPPPRLCGSGKFDFLALVGYKHRLIVGVTDEIDRYSVGFLIYAHNMSPS